MTAPVDSSEDRAFMWQVQYPSTEYGTYEVLDASGNAVCVGIGDEDLASDIASLPILKRIAAAEADRQRRQERDPQEGVAQLLVELLAEVRHIRARLDSDSDPVSDERSSFSYDSNSSAGKIKVGSKDYACNVDEAREMAWHSFVRGMAQVEQAQIDGWSATLEALEREQSE